VGNSDAALDLRSVKQPDGQVRFAESGLHHIAVDGRKLEFRDAQQFLSRFRLWVANTKGAAAAR
jgi:hypothetical protein